ncbi:MAG TPA: hypothetical protein VFW62_01880 [bacterium]|nr:hypothetical protein [bacterium]
MSLSNRKISLGALAFAYLVNLAGALYFTKTITTLHSAWLMTFLLAGVGLALGFGFSLLSESASAGTRLVIALIFAAVHGLLAYALAHYYFQLPWQAALSYPVGAAVSWIVFALLLCRYPTGISAVLAAAFLALGLIVALRLGGVWGGLVYSFGLLNSAIPGNRWLEARDEVAGELWRRAIFFAALLAAGRAAIQYYLLQSNYATLGVVVTHPYTYIGLFAGIFLPALLWVATRERWLHPALILVLLGVIFPLALGVFIHVRPFSAYLLGLVTASFLFGLLFVDTYAMGILAYLNLGAGVFGLPLFAKLSDLSRVARLEILGVLTIVLFLILAFLTPRATLPAPREDAP